jgi:hypothetical protein
MTSASDSSLARRRYSSPASIDDRTESRVSIGADIKFFRSNRLDVSVVQNHNIALCVVGQYSLYICRLIGFFFRRCKVSSCRHRI